MTAGLLPCAAASSLSERQQAVIAAALAYYDKGHSVQYDGDTINRQIDRRDLGKTRSTNKVSPEYATPHETMYTVCSDFAHQIYYEAFRYELLGSPALVWTKTFSTYAKDDPVTVWYFDKAEGKNREAEIKRMFTIAQPGDIFSVYGTKGGHTMIWAGDVDGDGKPEILHSFGHSFNQENSRRDTIEYRSPKDPQFDPRCEAVFLPTSNGGTIRMDDAEEYLSRYIESTKGRMTLLRPLVSLSESEYPTTPAAKYRVSHPRLAIDRMLNKTRFNSAFPGETVTMTLKLSNSSKEKYTVPVIEKSPAGAKLKTPFKDASVSGETQTLNVELPAGETKTLVSEYEITAKRGETVVFDGGFVGDIPSNSIPITVGGAKLTAEETEKLTKIANREYNQALREAGANNANLADVVYGKILGLNVKIPSYETIAKKFKKEVETPSGRKTNVFLKRDEIAAEDLEIYRMLVPNCWGGTRIWNINGSERCSDPRDLHLEPGDVVVREHSAKTADRVEQLVYLGGGKYLSYLPGRNIYPIVEEPEFFRCLLYREFFVLRPTLAYDDVHTKQ